MIAITHAPFFSAYRKAFGSLDQGQVDGLVALLSGFAADADLGDIRRAAYMLATVKHECANTYRPIAERGGIRYFDKYDPILADSAVRRARAIRMGNTKQGDGFKFRGRGYVQLTWQANYARAGKELSLPLTDNPDLVMLPPNAYRIMSAGMRDGWFTGKSLSDYITEDQCDYVFARRIINGTDQASLIAGYAKTFERCLRAGFNVDR